MTRRHPLVLAVLLALIGLVTISAPPASQAEEVERSGTSLPGMLEFEVLDDGTGGFQAFSAGWKGTLDEISGGDAIYVRNSFGEQLYAHGDQNPGGLSSGTVANFGLLPGTYTVDTAHGERTGAGQIQVIRPDPIALGTRIPAEFGPAGALAAFTIPEPGIDRFVAEWEAEIETRSGYLELLVLDALGDEVRGQYFSTNGGGSGQSLSPFRIEPGTYTMSADVQGRTGSGSLAIFDADVQDSPPSLTAPAPDPTTSGPTPTSDPVSTVSPSQTDVAILGIEVTQVVQDLDNSIGLVADKPTIMRVFAETRVDHSNPLFNMQVTAYRDGVALPGRTSREYNVVDQSLTTLDRVSPYGSFDFVLPATWITAGITSLEFFVLDDVLQSQSLACGRHPATRGTPGSRCGIEVTFRDVPPMVVHWVRVKRAPAAGQAVTQPSVAEVGIQEARVKDAFPVSEITSFIHEVTVEPGADSRRVLQWTQAVRAAVLRTEAAAYVPKSDEYGFVFGLVDAAFGRGFVRGLAEKVSPYPAARGVLHASVGSTGLEADGSRNVPLRNNTSHEFGHSLGLPHAVTNTRATGEYRNYLRGECGEIGSPDNPYVPFPWFSETFVPNRNPLNTLIATLGPTTPTSATTERGLSRTEVWGMVPRLWGDRADVPAIVTPHLTGALMSYCSGVGQGTFTSGRNYTLLYNEFTGLAQAEIAARAKAGSPVAPAADRRDDAVVRAALVVSDGPATRFTGVLDGPDPHLDAAAASEFGGTHETGDHNLELWAGETLVASLPFAPDLPVVETLTEDPEEEPLTTFTVFTEAPLDTVDEVRVTRDGVLLLTRSAGTTPPTLTFGPTGLDSSGIDASWSSGDVDDDPVSHDLFVRNSTTAPWRLVGAGLTAEQVDIGRLGLQATTTAQLRIDATDGIRTTTIVSDPFTIPPVAPALELLAPRDGLAITSPTALGLEAFAHDIDDPSALDDGDIVWRSSRDGQVATGPNPTLPPGTLSPGTHTLTVTATSATGRTTSRSITLVVDTLLSTSSDPVDQVIAISKLAYPAGSDAVVIGRDDNFADSPASGLVQAKAGGPLLLTPTGGIPQRVLDEIARLGATTAVIMGGPAAVSEVAESQLRSVGLTIIRFSGATRFDTATKAADRYAPDATAVLVARGHGLANSPTSAWADSIGGGTLAASSGRPILLTRTDRIPQETLDALTGVTHVTLLGGPAAISLEVEQQLRARGLTVTRLAGDAREDTAVEIAQQVNLEATTVLVVDGYADDGWTSGFAAASLARDASTVVVLGHPRRVPASSLAHAQGRALICGPNLTAAVCAGFRP